MKTIFNILKYKTLSSTNDKAKELLQKNEAANFTVVVADVQSKGRGQRKNTWHSRAGKNLTFSIIAKPIFLPATKQFYLSKVISLGIIDYLNSRKKGFKIKWPNDIYYKDMKICGILIENSLLGSNIKNSIIGIGLNINQKKFPDYLPDAISLFNIKNKEFNLETELQILLRLIYNKYELLQKQKYTEIDSLYHKYLYLINTNSNFKDIKGKFKGKIKETLPEGKLVIETLNNEIRTYNFKEVEFVN